MRIGFLHVGEPADGITRYGRLLAQQGRAAGEHDIVEAAVPALDSGSRDASLAGAAATLRNCDAVHIQLRARGDRAIWGGGRPAVSRLDEFARSVQAPLVVSVHDLYPRRPVQTALAHRIRRVPGPPPVPRATAEMARTALGVRRADRLPVDYAVKHAGAVLVTSTEERRRLPADSDTVEVIPHFVEARPATVPSYQEARRLLGLTSEPVLTVLGYIHPRKGHALAVEALPALADARLVFAGEATHGQQAYLSSVLDRAAALGVVDRVTVTGRLSDEDLSTWLAASDVGVCPFLFFAASGSLSTWLSARRPLVVSAQPQLADYDALAPGAIGTFTPYTSEALVQALSARLAGSTPGDDPGTARLAEALSLERIWQRHAAVYSRVAAGRR